MQKFDEYGKTDLQEFVNQINFQENRTKKPGNPTYNAITTKMGRLRNLLKNTKKDRKFIELNSIEKDKVITMQKR